MSQELLDRAQERVRRYLDGSGHAWEDRDGVFELAFGSTRVRIRAHRWTSKHTILRMRAQVLVDVGLDDNDHRFEEFNRMNDRFLFGKIFWTPTSNGRGDIVLEHNLIGETLDEEEFSAALLALAMAADDLDDRLQAHLGGDRAVEPTAR